MYGHWERFNITVTEIDERGRPTGTPDTQQGEAHFVVDAAAQTESFFGHGFDFGKTQQEDHGPWWRLGIPQKTQPQKIPCSLLMQQLPAEGQGYILKSGTRRDRQYAQFGALNTFFAVASFWSYQGHSATPMRIGEISIATGGKFGEHRGVNHALGAGFDIGLFRADGSNSGGAYYNGNYNQSLTQELVNFLGNFDSVTRIIFNDPNVTNPKIVRDKGGAPRKKGEVRTHDNHLHVEFAYVPCSY